MNISAKEFTVGIHNLQSCEVREKIYSTDLGKHQVLLEINRFSFTSNNITYGIVGERMNYWAFFPTAPEYGIIPVWGYANVAASSHPDIKVGDRFYGYYPMSSHLLGNVGRLSKSGFVDESAHRKGLPPIYNFYLRTDKDPNITPETEDLVSIYRPLFITSFLIDAFLSEEKFFHATQIILTSASSKTAQALAQILRQHGAEEDLNIKLIGLTSDRNVGFVDGLGWYDQVLSYDEIDHLASDERSIVVDFTGNHELQYRLQTKLEDKLLYNCLVGLVDWQNMKGKKQLPRKGSFFFAPDHAERLRKQWGGEVFQEKVAGAWESFIGAVKHSILIKEYQGMEELQKLYLDMLSGKVDPREGNIVQL